jgi:rhamnosyltransferase
LIHEIGQKQKKSIFSRKFYLLNHSEIRVYYMVRNRLCIIKRYWNVKKYRPMRDMKHLLTRTIAMIFFEEQKLAKLAATIRGVVDSVVNYKIIMKEK